MDGSCEAPSQVLSPSQTRGPLCGCCRVCSWQKSEDFSSPPRNSNCSERASVIFFSFFSFFRFCSLFPMSVKFQKARFAVCFSNFALRRICIFFLKTNSFSPLSLMFLSLLRRTVRSASIIQAPGPHQLVRLSDHKGAPLQATFPDRREEFLPPPTAHLRLVCR